jgi:hypothetical protein
MATPNQPNQPKKRRLKIERKPELDADYSNMVMISHTMHEMILDFMQVIPQDQRALINNRIVMTPTHAKLLLNALRDNLSKYEARFGEIATPSTPPSLADQLFQNIAGDGGNDGDDDKDGDDGHA